MYNYVDNLPRDRRELVKAQISAEVENGVHNPLPELSRQIRNRERNRQRNMVSLGLTTGSIGAVVLGTTLSLNPILTGLVGGGLLVGFAANGIGRYRRVKHDLDHDKIGPYLSDEELEGLDSFQQLFEPSTEEAANSHQLIKVLCDELLENGQTDAIEAKAEEVEKESPDKAEKGDLDNQDPIKDSWDTSVFPPRPKSLKPDNWIDPVQDTAKAAVHDEVREQIAEIQHVQGEFNQGLKAEVLQHVDSKLSDFEKAFLSAVETMNNKLDSVAQNPAKFRLYGQEDSGEF